MSEEAEVIDDINSEIQKALTHNEGNFKLSVY